MHQDREIRQESYLATKYEKARQDVGLFYCVFTEVYLVMLWTKGLTINFKRLSVIFFHSKLYLHFLNMMLKIFI